MKIKRVLSVFLAAALTVISAGCKKSKNNSASVGAALAQVSEQTGKFSCIHYTQGLVGFAAVYMHAVCDAAAHSDARTSIGLFHFR